MIAPAVMLVAAVIFVFPMGALMPVAIEGGMIMITTLAEAMICLALVFTPMFAAVIAQTGRNVMSVGCSPWSVVSGPEIPGAFVVQVVAPFSMKDRIRGIVCHIHLYARQPNHGWWCG